jgi:hypothetical protein
MRIKEFDGFFFLRIIDVVLCFSKCETKKQQMPILSINTPEKKFRMLNYFKRFRVDLLDIVVASQHKK